MDSKELIRFLKVLHGGGCLSPYWAARVAEVIGKIQGKPYERK